MTLLTIVKAAADEIQMPRPATVVGNDTPDAQRFLRYANKVGSSVMKKYAWQALRNEHTFTATATEEQTGALPDDFDRFVPETFWNRDSKEDVVGPVDPVRWQGIVKTGGNNSRPMFIYRDDSIYLSPTPTAGHTYAFEYVSNKWARSSGGTAQASFLADTDEPYLDEELMILGIIYEWLRSEGQPFDAALFDYRERLSMLVKDERASAGKLSAGDIFAQGSRRFDGVPTATGADIWNY